MLLPHCAATEITSFSTILLVKYFSIYEIDKSENCSLINCFIIFIDKYQLKS